MVDLSVAILCGGDSTRLGEDKTRIKINGKPLYRLMWEKLEGKGDEAFLQVSPEDHYNLPTRPDLLPQGGPLGAIYSALIHACNEWVFVSACDLPNLDPGIVGELALKLEEKGENQEVIIPRWNNGYYEPLVALYRRSLRAEMGDSLEKGTRKITDFLTLIKGVQEISVDRLIAEGVISSDCFFNVNTREDVAELNSS